MLFQDGAETTERNTVILPVPVHPDEKGLANQIGFRHGTPITTVIAVIAVITHHKIVALRNHKYVFNRRNAVANQYGMLNTLQIFFKSFGTGHIHTLPHALITTQ